MYIYNATNDSLAFFTNISLIEWCIYSFVFSFSYHYKKTRGGLLDVKSFSFFYHWFI